MLYFNTICAPGVFTTLGLAPVVNHCIFRLFQTSDSIFSSNCSLRDKWKNFVLNWTEELLTLSDPLLKTPTSQSCCTNFALRQVLCFSFDHILKDGIAYFNRMSFSKGFNFACNIYHLQRPISSSIESGGPCPFISFVLTQSWIIWEHLMTLALTALREVNAQGSVVSFI